MDLNLTEEQEMLRRTARELLRKECPTSFVREMDQDAKGVAFALWKRLADLGFLGIPLPESYGGGGQTFVDLVIVLEELGRVMFPGPILQTVAGVGMAILESGTKEQKEKVLPEIANGNKLATLAFLESGTSYSDLGVAMEAMPRDDELVLNGTKMFVSYADAVDWFLVATRTAGATHDPDGVTVLLIDSRSSGITLEPLKVRGSDRPNAVHFENVLVPRDALVGDVGAGWEVLTYVRTMCAVAQCAEMVGYMAGVTEMSVEYAKNRVQFGRPIGSFQAVQRHCTDMWSETEGARYLTYEAAWRLSNGLGVSKSVAMAKSFVSAANRRVIESAHQVHGAIGLTDEHDLTMYNRRMTAGAVLYGDATFHREVLAGEIDL